jgi:hypothetical protein
VPAMQFGAGGCKTFAHQLYLYQGVLSFNLVVVQVAGECNILSAEPRAG